MWGRATQIVVAVIALVLVRPANVLPAPTIAGFVTSGRAFAAYPDPRAETDVFRPVARRTLASYVRQTAHRIGAPSERTAVIVGINHAQGTTPLPGSVRDARNLHAALLGYGFREDNITLLLDGQATRSAILGALDSLALRTPASGVAVVAIATHTKRSGGTNLLATADGGRISAAELASRLGAVRSPAWVALPTCYAGGYAKPGIVGYNRVATFASDGNTMSYQAGSAGSFLFIHMVRRAMLEGRSPESVEGAFEFARGEIERDYPERVPSMSDGVPGDLVLGRISSTPHDTSVSTYQGGRYGYEHAESSPAPRPESRPSRRTVVVCGRFRYNC